MYREDRVNAGAGGCEDERRLPRHLCQRLGRKSAICLVNRHCMEDQAYKFVYGLPVNRDVRRALMWTVVYQAKHGKHPPAEKLYELVREANECSKPTARGHVKRAVDCGLLTMEGDGTKVFYFLTPDQKNKAETLLHLLDRIPEVVRAQAEQPYDKRAGSEHVPSEVYYNIIDVAAFPE